MWDPGARCDLVSAPVDGVNDVQAILDIRDRGVIWQVVDELLEDLLRRKVSHAARMP